MALFFRVACCFSIGLTLCADTVVQKDGTEVEGKIVRQDEEVVVVETAPGMKSEISRSDIREIRATAPAKPPASASVSPSSKAPVGAPQSSGSLTIPQPTIINQPNFRPEGTWGGLSDGKLLDIDGKPLTDHKVYSMDTDWFIKKLREGLSKKTSAEDKDRVQQLWYITEVEGVIRILAEDIQEGTALIKDPEKSVASKKTDLQSEMERYEKRFSSKPESSPEYELMTLVSKLGGATRAYARGEASLNYEEQLRVMDRINLDGGTTPKGKKVREQMKAAIHKMSELRDMATSRYRDVLEAGKLPEEDAMSKISWYEVSADRALMFPYQSITGDADGTVRDGLWQDQEGKPIGNAKPMILSKGQKVEFLAKETLKNPVAGAPETIEVFQVRVKSDSMVEMSNNAKLPMMVMEGWVLSSRLQKSSR